MVLDDAVIHILTSKHPQNGPIRILILKTNLIPIQTQSTSYPAPVLVLVLQNGVIRSLYWTDL